MIPMYYPFVLDAALIGPCMAITVLLAGSAHYAIMNYSDNIQLKNTDPKKMNMGIFWKALNAHTLKPYLIMVGMMQISMRTF